MPQLFTRVETAFAASGPFVDPDAQTWTDISSDVMAAGGQSGRSSESGRTSTGTCEIDLFDPAGKYDPANTSSPYYPNVKLDRLVRVRVSDYEDRMLTDQPVGYWRLDETSGTTAADSSGNGRTGTYVNTPTLAAVGPVVLETPNRAAQFAAASSERVDVAYAAALNPATVTVEAWIYRTGTGTDAIVTSLTANRGYRLQLSATNTVQWSVGTGASTLTVTGSTVIPASTWTHILATSTGSTQLVYINGALETLGVNTYAAALSGTLQIGADNSTNYFDGRIGEVAVYAAALPAVAARHRWEMASGRTVLFTGPVKDWRQNYGAGPGDTTVTVDAADLSESLERVSAPLSHEAIVRRLKPARWFRYAEIASGKVRDEGASPARAVASGQAAIAADDALGHDLTINGGVTYPLQTPGLNLGTADWTLSVWARSDTSAYIEQVTILARRDWPLGSGEHLLLRHWQHDVQAGTNSRSVTARCGRFPSAAQWTHYLVTRQTSGGNEIVTVWVNGDQIGTQSWATPTTNITGTTPVTAQPFSAGGTIHIAQMAVWTGTILTSTQIGWLWQSGPNGWRAQRPEDRISMALSMAGSSAATQLGRGSSLVAASGGGSALGICQDAATADEGMFLIDGRGRPTFHGRQSRRRLGTIPAYTFGDALSGTEVPYHSVTINNDDQKLWNTASVNGRRAQDVTSAATYGERAPSADETRPVVSPRDAEARAQGIVAAHKDPATRIDQIDWRLPQTRGGALALQLVPNDWIRVVRRPRAGQTITRDLHVEQRRWKIETGGGGGSAGEAQVTAQLSATDPAQNSALTLDASTFAATDTLTW